MTSLHKVQKKIKLIELVEKIKDFESKKEAHALAENRQLLDEIIYREGQILGELNEIDSKAINFINDKDSIFVIEQKSNYTISLHHQNQRLAVEIQNTRESIDNIKVKIEKNIKQNNVLSEKKTALKKDLTKLIEEKYHLDNT